jgi:hypothetical protein
VNATNATRPVAAAATHRSAAFAPSRRRDEHVTGRDGQHQPTLEDDYRTVHAPAAASGQASRKHGGGADPPVNRGRPRVYVHLDDEFELIVVGHAK